MTRARGTALIAAALALLFAPPTLAVASPPDLSGNWTLNPALSHIPRELGFGLDLFNLAGSKSGAAGSETPAMINFHESAEDAARRDLLVEEVRTPAANLTIDQAPDAVTITGEGRLPRTFHPDGREDIQMVGKGSVVTTSRWDGTGLEVRYRVEPGRELRYTYSRTDNPTRLLVQVRFIERGGHDVVTLVYEPSKPGEAAPAVATTAAGPAKSAGAAPPKLPEYVPASDLSRLQQQGGAGPAGAAANEVVKGTDAGLKGLRSLGVVVEDLSQQSITCGLNQASIESAVSKRFTDAGFQVLRNSDEDTYLYVRIVTTTGTGGLCVSRYDVYLYSNTMATLPYQSSPTLVEVELLHEGGIAGGRVGAHADNVVGPVNKAADDFVARIRAAGK